MKKHFLILASLVLGIGQLFADDVTFDASVLWQKLGGSGVSAQTVTTPYTWKASPYYVAVTFDGEGSQTVNTANVPFAKGKSFTVSAATTGTTISKVTFTLQQAGQKNNVGAEPGTYDGNTLTWTPAENTTPSSVTFTTTNSFQVKTITVEYTPGEAPNVDPDPQPTTGQPLVGPFEATPIDNIASYTGTDQYVFDMAARKYYALNNLSQYEEFGLYPEVSTLKVAGNTGVTEIEYIKTNTSMGTIPYINLNYIPKANTRVVATVNVAATGQTSGWKAVFGTGFWGNGWESRLCYFSCADAGKSALSLKGEKKGTPVYDQKVTIDLNNAASEVRLYDAATNTEITEAAITEVEPWTTFSEPLYVFAQNKKGSTDCYNPSMTLYSMKIYEGETLVLDLVPVVDGEGKGGLKDKLTGNTYFSANSGNFELSADGQAIAADAGISVYPGKLVINTADNHEYNWNGTEWVDLGSVYKPIETTNYQDMRREGNGGGWKCRFGYDETYNHIENNGNDNFFNPYVGDGNWEPYQCTVTGLTKGETYRVSFKFTSNGWNSWSSYTQLPVFVVNTPDFDRGLVPSGVGGAILGYVGLPQAAMTSQPYSFTFTADGTEATLAIQFGVGDDGKQFYFHFDDLNIEFVDYPQKYNISWTDPNKYTPLAYIDNTKVEWAYKNVFTTSYYAKATTTVKTKFQSYSGGNWRAIFSGRNGSDASSGISLYQNGDQAHFGYFVGGYRNDNHADYPGHNQDITVTASLGNLNVNGTDNPTNQTTFAASSTPISFFSNPGWDNSFAGRIYYFTIEEADETIYDFQPVMRHDGAFGYYDAATATFLQPAQGSYDGYGYAKLDDKAYVTYNAETRIVMVGGTAQFLPDVQNISGATFIWTSSDETKATVAADGTVTGKAAGKVMITVTTDADQGWTASYELTVSEPNYVRKDVNNVGYAVVTGGNGWGDSPVANLVDNDATTKFGCSGGGDAWAIIIASEPVAVQQYSFVTGGDTYGNPGRTPRDWKLEGSNDNQNWTVIDQQEQNYKAKTANKEQTVFTVNGTDTYKFFKFTAGNFNGGFQLGEFWINEQAHTWGEPTETASTCTVEGKKVWECTDCKALKTERLPLAAHNYENGVCTVCNAKVAEPILLANGQANDYIVKFRHKTGENNPEEIEAGWANANFDDSAWDELVMPIGTAGYGVQHTIWQNNYNTFWFRRNFNVENPAAITKLTLKLLHDDCCAVYLNGNVIRENPEGNDWTNGTEWLELDVNPSLLVAGNNVVAVYIEQNWGGAYCDFYLEGKAGAKVTVSDAGYATFVAPVDVNFNGAQVSAFAAQKEETWIKLEPVTTVPAGAAVVVKASEGTYTVPATTDAALGTENELVAATDDITANGTQYILAKVNDKVGFAKAVANSTIAKGKGYLTLTAPVKPFYPFGDDDATGIDNLNVNDNLNEVIYNVAGQRMNKAQKGINIVNGKKILK